MSCCLLNAHLIPPALLLCVMATAAHGRRLSSHVDETPPYAWPDLAKRAVVTADATPTEAARESLPVALYVVLAIIVMFVMVIVSLSVVVVLLYRRKCGRMEVATHGEPFKGAIVVIRVMLSTYTIIGEDGGIGGVGANMYDGFATSRYACYCMPDSMVLCPSQVLQE